MRPLLGALLTMLTLGGCADRVTAVEEVAVTSTLALSSGQANATGIVRGVVMGSRTVGGGTVSERVGGATIDVQREVRDSVGSGPVHVTSTRIGSLVTAADGSFTLTDVQSGYYRLDVTPPATSPYRAGTSGTESFESGSTSSATVYLQQR